MKPNYEELESALANTRSALANTQELLKSALDRILELEERLNLDSKNSSKPPSSDQKGNTPPNGKKKRKERKGIARSNFPPDRIDKHMECTQDNCPHCGSSSIHLDKRAHEIVQQVELPEVRALVTEYLLRKYSCHTCGQKSTARLPEGIPHSAFGPKLMGLLATLTGLFHLAKREAILLIKDLYDIDVGLGSIPNIEERVSAALDPIYQRIHHFVMMGQFCKHFDETSWRDSGKRHFVWLGSCDDAAFYMIDRTRSAKAFQRLVGTDPSNLTAVTDRYAVYNAIGTQQYCFAHLRRDFHKYSQRDGPDREIGLSLKKKIGQICKIHGTYRKREISWEHRNKRLEYHKRKVEGYLVDGIANGSEKLYRLCETLLDHSNKLWAFMKIPGMEPTNNMAERDMRKLVIWRKKSYGTRSERGKNFVERITSVTQTLRRQRKNTLKFIQEAVVSFYCNREAPFISESLGF